MNSFSDHLCEVIALESGLSLQEVSGADGLMSTGILDSFALVTVITLVETHLGREVSADDLTFENFDSVQAICGFVGRVHAR